MKKLLYLPLILIVLNSCNNDKKQSGTPIVDVTKSYPKKEIVIQDIANVEYVPLETRDDVLIAEYHQQYMISPDSLLIGNYSEGTVFLFNGKGKVLSKFNHKGASDKEYKEIWGIYYDNKAKEIIIFDYPFKYQFQVYDINGKYKRTIPIAKKYSLKASEIINFNDKALLCHNGMNYFKAKSDTLKNKIHQPFLLLSKKDGKELGRLPIKYPKRVSSAIIKRFEGGSTSVRTTNLTSIVKKGEDFICSDISKDTIFLYTKNQQLKPLVIRTPEVTKMDENRLSFLQVIQITPKYIFAEIVDKRPNEENKFPKRIIAIDRATNKIFECNVKNNNFNLNLDSRWLTNNGMLYGADFLKELLEKDKLKGELKTIAENLNDDDNPVWIKISLNN